MATQWVMTRLPKHLHDRLVARADAILTSYQEKGGNLPSEYCERVPLHHVIERALDELDGHHARAKEQRQRKTRAARNAALSEGMYTSPTDVK